MSEAITRGIRVTVRAAYVPERSSPHVGTYLFAYRIRIANESPLTVQLTDREWVITDGDGHVETVVGEGVVGVQPVLAPDEAFEYTSFCPLQTPLGTMEGRYTMRDEAGEGFKVHIAPFALVAPHLIN